MANDLMIDLQQIFGDYERDLEAQAKKDIAKAGRDCASYVRDGAPKDSGEYAKGWRSDVEDGVDGFAAHVHASGRHASLTHLLEHGHEQFFMGEDLGYRTPGKPHIEPAFERASAELLGRMHG